jgi:6-phosphogluconolactonase (cycloisomerase 2 family)
VQRDRYLRKKIQTLVLCLAGMSAVPALPVAAQSHHFVYLSSATTQTISGFEISQASGAVTAVAGSPFQEGRDPNGLAFHPTGRFLYAVNPGDQSVSGFVQ